MNALAIMAVLTMSVVATADTTPTVITGKAHDPARWFPFPPRSVDSLSGEVDLSALDTQPAGASGFIRVENGHFVDRAGRRVRFFGVNCTATACFPSHDTAIRVAAHLHRIGVNVVRFHFMDSGPKPIGLWTADRKGFDPEQLDRMDFFIAELVKNGIYVNLNLHVARRYEGIEGDAAQRFEFGKMLDRYYPPFIDAQREYARALLGHENPYTNRTYLADPAVLCVEMNNENTALPFWAGNLDDLPEPFAGELRRQWNVWLRDRYHTSGRLLAAWHARGRSREIVSPDVASTLEGWTFESAGVPTQGEVVATEDGAHAIRFSADRSGTESWHLQFYRAHVPLAEGRSYGVSFRARAPARDAAVKLEVTAMIGVPDWRNIGLARTIALGPDWQNIEVRFRAQGTVSGEGRLNFSLRNIPGVVEVADLRVVERVAPPTLATDQRIERGTIPLVPGEGGTFAGEDFLRFLADTDRATARSLGRFIRRELGLQSLLVDSQPVCGGLDGLKREMEVSDFIDMHGYWQHPEFPSGWSNLRFHIANTSQTAATDGGALKSLAGYRVAGKPFTVSEYNVPTPSDYAAEALPMYAAIAAVQDWDAIYAYTYLDFSPRWDADHLLGFFDLAGNPAAQAFLPIAALTFRTGMVAPALSVARLPLPAVDARSPPRVGEGALATLWSRMGVSAVSLASERLEIDARPPRRTHPIPSGRRSTPSTSDVHWDPAQSLFWVVAPGLRMAVGALAGRSVDLGGVRFSVGELPRGNAAFALVALDGAPLEESARMLLVAVARVENTGMQFNSDRTGLLSWGHAPTLAEYVPFTITLPWNDLRAARLDAAGEVAAEIPLTPVPDGAGSVLRLEHQPSLWFLIHRSRSSSSPSQ
jgi:hypothetical protein